MAIATLGAAPAAIVQPAASGEPWSADAVAQLGSDLNAMLAASPAIHGAHVGVYAIDTATGDVLYARDADDEFQPASTLKLVVGSAALEKLGPAFAFHTHATLYGTKSIRLIGGGDPTLTSADLDAAAREIAEKFTVRRIDDVQVDARRYERKPYPAGWTWDDFGQDYAPVVSAMTLDENVAHLNVRSTSAPSAAVTSRSDVTIVPPDRPCDQRALGRIGVGSLVAEDFAGKDDTVDVRIGNGGCIEVYGKFPHGGPPDDIDAAVPLPEMFAKTTFRDALVAAGIVVPEPTPAPPEWADDAPSREPITTVRSLPEPVTAWDHDSQPLEALIGPRFWIPSDNLFGELLLRELGRSGTPDDVGTVEKGVAYETHWLESIGVDPATTTLADGCGMSQYDRITPRDLVTILQHDWDGPNRQLVLDSLPVGGARGTIEGIAGTPVAGRVFAKTGSMMHVRGLAGYLATMHHGAVTFAFNVDDWNGDYPALAALRAHVLTRIVTDGS